MKKRDNFNSPVVARMSDAFPQAVITDGYIFLSGMPGTDSVTGKVVGIYSPSSASRLPEI